MDLIPLQIKTNCAVDEATLYEHIRLALQRNLPLIQEHFEHGGVAVLVAPGPSVKEQLESIRKQRELGNPIIAITSAHDWLIENGIIPDYAVAIDPLPDQKKWFKHKNKEVRYMVGSQCHPDTFDHFADCKVFLWHLYIKEGQTYPPDSILVTGGTTAGLRAINLFYSMGFRQFELYGYDSCLQEGQLRIGGTDNGDKHVEIIVGGERFITTPPMAAQANEFQNLYQCMPDMYVNAHGRGIISKILEERRKAA